LFLFIHLGLFSEFQEDDVSEAFDDLEDKPLIEDEEGPGGKRGNWTRVDEVLIIVGK
jgi:hypothetical protein